MRPPAPLLHRDDPDKAPLVGHVKVTREDWLNVARDILVRDGVGEVKILPISQRLDVSRSSFYWYFKSRGDLLSALLEEWESRNTASIVDRCAMPAETITGAVCHFFRCFIDPELFDQGMDFAVREWARRDDDVRDRVDAADQARLAALTEMYLRHDYAPDEADIRARVLYYMQLGYHALDVQEPMEERSTRLAGYLLSFTGRPPRPEEVEESNAFAMQVTRGQ